MNECSREPLVEREVEKFRTERAIYRRLLDDVGCNDPRRVLEETLAALTDVCGAARGFIELREDDDLAAGGEGASRRSRWSTSCGFGNERRPGEPASLPRGVLDDVLLTRRTVEVGRLSVDDREIDVDPGRPPHLCVPIRGDGVVGALYLDGQRPFDRDAGTRARLFAELVAPLAARAVDDLSRERHHDAMRELRRLYGLEGIIGRSSALASTCRQAMRAAGLDITVLLTGASGTGKSQLARLIHDNSDRARGPFVDLNCATLPENLIESELFGARAGSHSQAKSDVPGKVAAAEGGTLLLDEIAELPISAQAKLLQLIQSHDYFALGSSHARHADVRIIAATHVDLGTAVAERRFRDDLYFRLNVLPIRLPALNERRDDVPLIAKEVCRCATTRHGLPRCELGRDAIRSLRSADWPGNVRQLANVVEAAAIRAATEGRSRIERRHLFPDERPACRSVVDATRYHDATRDFQRKLLTDTLEATGWNVSEAARRLGITRSHVYNLVHGFGLHRVDPDRRPRCSDGARSSESQDLVGRGRHDWQALPDHEAVQP